MIAVGARVVSMNDCRSRDLLQVNNRSRLGKPSDYEVRRSCCDSGPSQVMFAAAVAIVTWD